MPLAKTASSGIASPKSVLNALTPCPMRPSSLPMYHSRPDALEKSTPRLQVAEEVLSLGVPSHTIGEAVGVAKNSKGHLFVFTRSGNLGPAKGATASQLFDHGYQKLMTLRARFGLSAAPAPPPSVPTSPPASG